MPKVETDKAYENKLKSIAMKGGKYIISYTIIKVFD